MFLFFQLGFCEEFHLQNTSNQHLKVDTSIYKYDLSMSSIIYNNDNGINISEFAKNNDILFSGLFLLFEA